MATVQTNQYLARRPLVLGVSKVIALAAAQLPLVQAAPLLLFKSKDEAPEDPQDASLWLYLGFAAILVLLGGAFAGLTIALMGQDEIYLQVIKTSGEGAERKHAASVLKLLGRGKHWVLVTLLLGNVITNETLPIILDRSLGGGWPAVLGSTVLIVIFGEIAPQSVCVRYGLPIGSWMAPFVLTLMYILAPVSWPTAKLLDWLLGQDHGTVYKKAGLKTLVSLHKSLGDAGQQLNSDEVTIISAVLDLKDKSIGSIMTPMDDVFTMSLDDTLDEETMDVLLSQGYSRIPIHHPDNDENFVGMLLVKMLITYDPEDAKPVRDFALATLPETRPDTSCLDIVNFFQEGKSHMVLVSSHPGEDRGAMGVVTLEDVIEELIGEEIIDESDVFVDVHKAIRRMAPAPFGRMRAPKGHVVTDSSSAAVSHEPDLVDIGESDILSGDDIKREKTLDGTTKQKSSPVPRRRSSAADSNTGNVNNLKIPGRSQTAEMKEHLKHLGPSNLASRPKATRYNTVKIKQGSSANPQTTTNGRVAPARRISQTASDYYGGIGEGLLATGGKEASDGVQALHAGYGSIGSTNGSPIDSRSALKSKAVQVEPDLLDLNEDDPGDRRARSAQRPERRQSGDSRSRSTIRSLPTSRRNTSHRGPARSGSITENIIDVNGVRKVVLETTSSSSDDAEENSGANKSASKDSSMSTGSGAMARLRGGNGGDDEVVQDEGDETKKSKRRRRKRGGTKGERDPLLR